MSKTSAEVLLFHIYSYVSLIVLLPFVCNLYLHTPPPMHGLIHIYPHFSFPFVSNPHFSLPISRNLYFFHFLLYVILILLTSLPM